MYDYGIKYDQSELINNWPTNIVNDVKNVYNRNEIDVTLTFNDTDYVSCIYTNLFLFSL